MAEENEQMQALASETVPEQVPDKKTEHQQIGFLSISHKDKPLSEDVTNYLLEIQNAYPKLPLWVIMQDGDDDNELSDMGHELWNKIYLSREDLKENEPILILCVSPGGSAEYAYRIAKLINNKCGEFKIIVPHAAKSAATLLALGAEEIIIGKEGDLGPLDVQIRDLNEEREYSGLDEVQSLDGLFDFANDKILTTTIYWSRTLRRKRQSIFPAVIEYVTGMMKPLMEKIDTVHYMSLSRKLKVAEEYAYRLLLNKYGFYQAKIISKSLVENYPYHGFIIDKTESERIGLKNVTELSKRLQEVCDKLLIATNDCSTCLIGKFFIKTFNYEKENNKSPIVPQPE